MSNTRRRINFDDTPKTPYKKPKSSRLQMIQGRSFHDIEDIYREDEYFDAETDD